MIQTIHQTALERALRMLDAIGAQYAIQYDGQTYGALELAPPPKRRKDGRPHYKRGTTRAHYWPYIKDMAVGDDVSIPYADFDPHILAGNTSAACTHAWGLQSAVVQRDDEARVVNVLRIG